MLASTRVKPHLPLCTKHPSLIVHVRVSGSMPCVTTDSIRGNYVVTRRFRKRRYLYYDLISDRTVNFDQILVELNHREQAIRDSVIMTLMSRHTPSQPRSLPSTEEFAQRLKYLFLQVLGNKMVRKKRNLYKSCIAIY